MTAAAPSTADLRPWVCRFVRVGYAAKGLIYLLIGTLALRVGLGLGGRVTDSSGALRTLIEQPFGFALIAAISVGLLAYAGWEISDGLFDATRKGRTWKGWLNRGLTIIKGAVYGAIGIEGVRMLLHVRQSSSEPDDYARTALQFPLGGVVLGLVGLGVILYGLSQLWDGFRSNLDSDLDRARMQREMGRWTTWVGRAGIAARGVILTVAGGAVVRAGFTERPDDAAGTSETLWTLFTQPFGPGILAIVAAGLICYGVFQLLHARYVRL